MQTFHFHYGVNPWSSRLTARGLNGGIISRDLRTEFNRLKKPRNFTEAYTKTHNPGLLLARGRHFPWIIHVTVTVICVVYDRFSDVFAVYNKIITRTRSSSQCELRRLWQTVPVRIIFSQWIKAHPDSLFENGWTRNPLESVQVDTLVRPRILLSLDYSVWWWTWLVIRSSALTSALHWLRRYVSLSSGGVERLSP